MQRRQQRQLIVQVVNNQNGMMQSNIWGLKDPNSLKYDLDPFHMDNQNLFDNSQKFLDYGFEINTQDKKNLTQCELHHELVYQTKLPGQLLYGCERCSSYGLQAKNGVWACNSCAYNVCMECYQKAKAQAKPKVSVKAQPKCSKGHGLKFSMTLPQAYPNNEFACDLCGQTGEASKNGVYHCDYCQYDVCPDCIKKGQKPKIMHMTSFGQDVPEPKSPVKTAWSPYEMLKKELRASGQKWLDKDFPCDISSIAGKKYDQRNQKWKKYVWLRPEKIYPDGYELFQEEGHGPPIDPCDIKQGTLGDCYFLCVLSALSEIPKRILKLFGSLKRNKYGVYCAKICDMGVWKDILVDDRFPCFSQYDTRAVFSQGQGPEIWVLVLEKAFAKLYGDYLQIESGITREVLHDLSGAPAKTYWMDDPKLWQRIYEAEKKDWVMTCGTDDQGPSLQSQGGGQHVMPLSDMGIVSFHAYTLLSGHKVQSQGEEVHLVRLRNPWGEKEWKGSWNDKDFQRWTPELKKKLDWEDKNDGIFFMTFDDFKKYFSDMQICYYQDDYEYCVAQSECGVDDPVYFQLNVYQEGDTYITVNQKNKRHFQESEGYKYSNVHITVGKMLPNGKYKWVNAYSKADKEVYVTCKNMTKGKYLVRVEIDWYNSKLTPFTLSCYYPEGKDYHYELKDRQESQSFLPEIFKSHAQTIGKRKSYANQRQSNTYKVREFSKYGFAYYYYNNVEGNKTLEETVKFPVFKGLKMFRQQEGKTSFTVKVPPGQDKIVLIKMLSGGWDMSSSTRTDFS